jgi:hypothetical protein
VEKVVAVEDIDREDKLKVDEDAEMATEAVSSCCEHAKANFSLSLHTSGKVISVI